MQELTQLKQQNEEYKITI
jgi:chromosome segregation ATPase